MREMESDGLLMSFFEVINNPSDTYPFKYTNIIIYYSELTIIYQTIQ